MRRIVSGRTLKGASKTWNSFQKKVLADKVLAGKVLFFVTCPRKMETFPKEKGFVRHTQNVPTMERKNIGRQARFEAFAMPVFVSKKEVLKMSLPCAPVSGHANFDAFVRADLALATGQAFDLRLIDLVFNHV